MKKLRSILVPVDFSRNSVDALKFASIIAKANSCKIKLLNIITEPQFLFVYPDNGITSPLIISSQQKMISQLRHNNLKRLINLKDFRILDGIDISSHVIIGGSVYKEIVNYAEKIKADLIIMGAKGNNTIKEIFLGTNAERVIRLTAIPVIAFNGKFTNKKIKKIVFASDFSSEAGKIYPVINLIIKNFNSSVYLLKINSKRDFLPFVKNIAAINRFKKRFKGRFFPKIRSNIEIDSGIANFAKLIKADLVVMGVHRKKGVSRLLGNRLLEGVLKQVKIPVLAVDIP